jgi:hypothetical protein
VLLLLMMKASLHVVHPGSLLMEEIYQPQRRRSTRITHLMMEGLRSPRLYRRNYLASLFIVNNLISPWPCHEDVDRRESRKRVVPDILVEMGGNGYCSSKRYISCCLFIGKIASTHERAVDSSNSELKTNAGFLET